MSLAEFEPASEKVVIGKGKTLTVHGLTLPDLSLLVRAYYSHLGTLFDRYLQNSADDIFGTSNLDQFLMSVVQDTPEIAALIIALAAKEPDARDNAQMIPFPAQIAALVTIFKLTFEEVGGPKKFGETLQTLIVPLLPPDAAARIGEWSRNLRAPSIPRTGQSGTI